jgi:hypothetical protein
VARKVESKNMAMATRRTNPIIYRKNNAPSSKTPQPTRLTPQQLEERKEKGLCFNCDSKYNKGHKCGEKKLLYIDCEEEEVLQDWLLSLMSTLVMGFGLQD